MRRRNIRAARRGMREAGYATHGRVRASIRATMPVTYGDPELRAGLADVRELVASARERSGDFMRTLGR